MCIEALNCRNLIFDPSIVSRKKDKPYPDCIHYPACKTRKFEFFEPLPEDIKNTEIEIRRQALSNFSSYLRSLGGA